MNIKASKRLFFCVTPLNIMIAQAIRARSPGEDTLVYVPSLRSTKFRHYYDRFAWDRKIIASFGPGRLPDLAYQAATAIKLDRILSGQDYDELLFAAEGSIPFSAIARRYPNAAMATFDDGTLHTDANRLAAWIGSEPRSHKLYRRLTGHHTLSEELARVRTHYTIYPAEFCQVPVPDIIELPLFEELDAPRPGARPVRVLLGTPTNEDDLGIDEEHYQRLIAILNPDIYLAHPREQRSSQIRLQENDAEPLRKAASLLAAEDFVGELVKFGYKPSTTGFGSTALLNLARQLETTTIFARHNPPERIFAELGVTCIPIDEVMT
jgi:hypothetical protein